MREKLIVIGGGAAGFFCAVNAARINKDLEVVLIEKTHKLLSKVKVSGGGRCNVTHACSSISELVKNYPRGSNFLKKAFHHFSVSDTIAWFEERGVLLKTESDGRMFPVTNTSQTIIDCLIGEMNRNGIELMLKAEVVRVEQAAEGFNIYLADSRVLETKYLCICCGGFPVISKFDWLKNLGLPVVDPVPSLFTFNMPGSAITALMGVAVEKAIVKIAGTKLEEEGALLITHWGMSGPVILKLSAWGARELEQRQYHFSILVNWLPAYNEHTLKEKFTGLRISLAAQKLVNRNPFLLPQRLWEFLLISAGISGDIRWSALPAKGENKMIKALCAQEFNVKGKTTFKEEFVTAGGISLADVDPSSMMSKSVNGLYFAGEVLDIDGITGGFNFQSAWTTGYIVAQSLARRADLVPDAIG